MTTSSSSSPAAEGGQNTLSFASRTIDEVQAGLGDEPPVVFKLVREMMRVYAVAHFTVDGEPASKARARWDTKRGGRPYTPATTRRAQEKVGWLYRKAVGPHPTPTDVSFGVFAAFFCSTNRRRDVDNMLKLVLDGLNKVALADDSQVLEVSGRVVRNVPKGEARTEILIYKVPSYTAKHVHLTCTQCGTEYHQARSLAANALPMCSTECRSAYWREHRAKKAEGTCEDCGGPTSKKTYRRCNACRIAAQAATS